MTKNQPAIESMSLDAAIAHADERASALSGPCAEQHAQLALWLRELREHWKAATPIYQLRDWHWYDAEKRIYDEVTVAGGEGRIVYTAPQPAIDALKLFAEFMAAESIKSGDYPDGWQCKAANAAWEYSSLCIPQPATAVEAVPVVPDGLAKAVAFYRQVERENPPVETGAWKDAVDWIIREALAAAPQ